MRLRLNSAPDKDLIQIMHLEHNYPRIYQHNQCRKTPDILNAPTLTL